MRSSWSSYCLCHTHVLSASHFFISWERRGAAVLSPSYSSTSISSMSHVLLHWPQFYLSGPRPWPVASLCKSSEGTGVGQATFFLKHYPSSLYRHPMGCIPLSDGERLEINHGNWKIHFKLLKMMLLIWMACDKNWDDVQVCNALINEQACPPLTEWARL